MTEHTVVVRPFAVTVEATTELAAPVAKAWKVLADTAAYPEWNPFVTSFDGPLAVGQRVRIELSLPGRKPQRMQPRLVEVVPGRSFTWLGSVGVRGLFDGRHHFELVPEGEDRCRLVQSERLSGLLVPLFRGLLTGPTPRAFVSLNEAFAERVADL